MINLPRNLYRFSKKMLPPAKSPIVLCYHAVNSKPVNCRPLVVSQEYFREQLKIIKKHYRPISLSELQDALLTGNVPKRAALVTLDDNYKQHLSVVLPILEDMQIPATVFISSGYVDSKQEYFWDELERLILSSDSLPSAIELEHDEGKTLWQINGQGPVHIDWLDLKPPFEPRQKAYWDLLSMLAKMDKDGWERSMKSLREQVSADGIARETHRLLTKDELIELAGSKWIEIGSHTCNHVLLAESSEQTQKYEIVQDKANLEKLLKYPITSLSYPYGGPDDIGDKAVEIAKQAGHKIAFTTDWLSIRRDYDLFRLPRLLIDDWSGDEFRKSIHFWK